MINLLPTDDKAQVHAARHNTILVRYVFLFSLVLLTTLGLFGGGFYLAERDKSQARDVLEIENAKASEYAKVKQRAEEFSKDLATAKSVFSNGVSYSQLLLDVAEIVPSGTIINSLNLSASTFGTPITISGRAKSLTKVEELKSSLESSDLFEKVSTVSVTVEQGQDNSSSYDYSVTLNATLSKPKVAGQ